MLDKKEIVIDTGPIIALVAALGDLSILHSLYDRVLVPYEVCQDILVGGPNRFALNEFEDASWLVKWPDPLDIAPILINSLDIGEASVIQLALNEEIRTVCIDEPRARF
jgi:predicted nucleic acid-binding protein